MYEGILFDLDNLLVDTEPWHYEAYRQTMESVGISITPEERLKCIGVPAPRNIERLLKEKNRTDVDPEQLAKKRQQLYFDFIRTKDIALMPGAHDLLTWVNQKNIPRIIASSSTREQIDMTIRHTELTKYFSLFVSFEDVPNGKPFPDIYLEAARRIELPPAQCVVFDDASAGIVAGKLAGCFTIGVPNQYTEHGDFSVADLVVNSLSEVDYPALFVHA